MSRMDSATPRKVASASTGAMGSTAESVDSGGSNHQLFPVGKTSFSEATFPKRTFGPCRSQCGNSRSLRWQALFPDPLQCLDLGRIIWCAVAHVEPCDIHSLVVKVTQHGWKRFPVLAPNRAHDLRQSVFGYVSAHLIPPSGRTVLAVRALVESFW